MREKNAIASHVAQSNSSFSIALILFYKCIFFILLWTAKPGGVYAEAKPNYFSLAVSNEVGSSSPYWEGTICFHI